MLKSFVEGVKSLPPFKYPGIDTLRYRVSEGLAVQARMAGLDTHMEASGNGMADLWIKGKDSLGKLADAGAQFSGSSAFLKGKAP
jgi:hypothetical protein